MTDAFTIKNYSILTSFNKTQIYMKLVDTVTHMVYETNVEHAELRLSLTLEDIYKIITACFGEDEGYKVGITVRSGLMKMKFHAVVGGFLRIDFDILVKEKNHDKRQSTISLHAPTGAKTRDRVRHFDRAV